MSILTKGLREKIVKLYNRNHRTGKFEGKGYDYTCPSPMFYPFQWLWDSCFHAIVLSHFDVNRAKNEIRTLLLNQRKNGFVPCVSFWRNTFPLLRLFYITEGTQPPVIPVSVEIVYKKSKDKKFLKDVYPKLKLYMKWLWDNRDTNRNGLIEIVHPWETGIDVTPSFDKQLGIKEARPGFLKMMLIYATLSARYYLLGWDSEKVIERHIFVSEELLFNCIYAKSLKAMEGLAGELGEMSDKKLFAEKYVRTKSAILKYYWSDKDKIFYNLDGKGHLNKIKTISSLAPLILDDLPRPYVEAIVRHLTNKKEFWSAYPIPSVAIDERTFDPAADLVLWRGTVWLSTNWFLVKALAKHEYKKEARMITEATLKMIGRSGFREHFNPLTGEGHGRKNFTWPGLVLDMLVP